MALGGRLAPPLRGNLCRLDTAFPILDHGKPGGPSRGLRFGPLHQGAHVCLEDPAVDGALILYTPQGPADPAALAKAMSAVARPATKPVITVFMGGSAVSEARENFRHNSVPTYDTPEKAVKTYFYMYKYKSNLEQLYETPAELPWTSPRRRIALRRSSGASAWRAGQF